MDKITGGKREESKGLGNDIIPKPIFYVKILEASTIVNIFRHEVHSVSVAIILIRPFLSLYQNTKVIRFC